MTNGDLGANEWLADEMFEAFQKDPNSVDPAWIEYFKKNNMIAGNFSAPTQNSVQTPSAPVGNPIAGAPNGGVPPTPKAATPAPAPVAPVQAAPVVQTPVAAPVVPATPVAASNQQVLNNRNKPEPTPADPQVKPAPVVAAPSSARVEPLRGVAGQIGRAHV